MPIDCFFSAQRALIETPVSMQQDVASGVSRCCMVGNAVVMSMLDSLLSEPPLRRK